MTNPKSIKIEDYNYNLPDEKIAKFPLDNRGDSKLLVYKNEQISETQYQNLSKVLPEDAFLVFNNTKVVKARLIFQKPTGGKVEIFCLEPKDFSGEMTQAMAQKESSTWYCLVGGAKKWKEGAVYLETPSGLMIKAERKGRENDAFVIQFSWTPISKTFSEVLKETGELPLPPYINRKAEETDQDRYQTTFAKHEGSVAAPTAGLHFTPQIKESLQEKNIEFDYLTLHVGAGTFKPVDAEEIGNHDMHFELFETSKNFLISLKNKIEEGKQIIPVGTTSLRTLESLFWIGQNLINGAAELNLTQWTPYQEHQKKATPLESFEAIIAYLEKHKQAKFVASTQLMIAPGYEFKIASGIVTNFHQPKSTLLLLVSAMIGENWKKVYDYALNNDFRFLSYGDGCLLMKK